jgi:FixJ family two-component response regulator
MPGRIPVFSDFSLSPPTTGVMPRVKTAAPVRQRYSLDLRERVVFQRHTLGRKTKRIARELDIPLRVVQRILEMWADLGKLVEPSRAHKLPKLQWEHLEVCSEYHFK